MTHAQLHTDTKTVGTKRPLPALPIHQWQNELNYLEQEIIFYKKLLGMGLHNGSEAKKPQMYALLEALSECGDVIFPSMHSAIKKWEGKQNRPTKDALAFENKLNRHLIKLRNIKHQIFPLFPEFLQFTIV